MQQVFKRFALVLLVLIVASQGYTAVAMPFCQHKPASDHPVFNHTAGSHSDDAYRGGKSTSKLACDDCAFCQLCAAPALISMIAVLPPQLAHSFNPESPAHFVAFIPAQPLPPPLS